MCVCAETNTHWHKHIKHLERYNSLLTVAISGNETGSEGSLSSLFYILAFFYSKHAVLIVFFNLTKTDRASAVIHLTYVYSLLL